MKMKEIGPKEGVRVPSAPVDPPMGITLRINQLPAILSSKWSFRFSQPKGQILLAQTIVILKLCTNTMTYCLAQIFYRWVVPFSNLSRTSSNASSNESTNLGQPRKHEIYVATLWQLPLFLMASRTRGMVRRRVSPSPPPGSFPTAEYSIYSGKHITLNIR